QLSLMIAQRKIAHVIGFQDAPFVKMHRGHVLVVGAVYWGAAHGWVVAILFISVPEGRAPGVGATTASY
ncbi:MAG: hypothetical protein ACREV8_10755, partial [Gammaproteobacteria bacterium]